MQLFGAGLLWAAAAAADAAHGLDTYVGPSILRLDFREYSNSDDRLVRELGALPGVAGGVGQTTGHWRWSARLSYYSGAVDYAGQTQSGARLDTVADATVARVRAQALRLVDQEGRLAAGIGLGYRQWQRSIRARGNISGLDERFESAEVSVDARVSALSIDGAKVDLDLQLAWPIGPQVKVDFGGNYDTQTLKLGPRLATRVSVPVSWAVGPVSRIVVEPGFEAWRFGRSNTETLTRWGVPVGVVYQPQGKGYNFDLSVVWVRSY